MVALVSEVFDRDLRSKGHRSGGPKFEEQDGEVVVHLMKGERSAREYNDVSVWNSPTHFSAIKDEVNRRMFPIQDHIVMVFAETYEDGPADRVWPGHIAKAVALPARGGIAVFSAWMRQYTLITSGLDWPIARRDRIYNSPAFVAACCPA